MMKLMRDSFAMLAEFGMTPSSRSKVSKDKPDDDDVQSIS